MPSLVLQSLSSEVRESQSFVPMVFKKIMDFKGKEGGNGASK